MTEVTEHWYDRTALLLGSEPLKRLFQAHVLVVGVGGVGSAAVEQLVRAGTGRMTLVDADTVQLTNLNRQVPALTSTMGCSKVQVMGERMKDINPSLELTLLEQFLTEEDVETLLDENNFDFVVDAIDTLAPKVSLLYHCVTKGIPVVSAMGAGGKVDPLQIRQVDISKTEQCPLAKVVRRELRLKGVKSGVPVVFSMERSNKEAVIPTPGLRNKRSSPGTVSYMPVVFGCHLAAYVIRQLTR